MFFKILFITAVPPDPHELTQYIYICTCASYNRFSPLRYAGTYQEPTYREPQQRRDVLPRGSQRKITKELRGIWISQIALRMGPLERPRMAEYLTISETPLSNTLRGYLGTMESWWNGLEPNPRHYGW